MCKVLMPGRSLTVKGKGCWKKERRKKEEKKKKEEEELDVYEEREKGVMPNKKLRKSQFWEAQKNLNKFFLELPILPLKAPLKIQK